ncbi:MAG: hypothetical protein ACK5UX_01035 [Burkholderiales bacterium]
MGRVLGLSLHSKWLLCVPLLALLVGCADGPSGTALAPKPVAWQTCIQVGACGATLRCESRMVELEGTVDRFSIHDRSVNPLFPVDKFLFQTGADHPAWEVWLDTVAAADRPALFSKLRLAASTGKRVRIVARAVGVDAQLTGACQRFLRFEVLSADALKD